MTFFLEQLETLKGQQSDISKQLEALKSGSVPNKEELDQIQSLDTEVAEGEALLADLNKKSSKLRAKVQLLSATSM
jgi:peptidoglycan hydrolase CwlO-like protein